MANQMKGLDELRIARVSDWDLLFADFMLGENEQIENLKKSLREKKFSVKDSGITYRVINHWSAQSLILDEREGRAWRKLSSLDLIWLNVLVELRKFGLSLPSLKLAFRKAFFMSPDFEKELPIFDMGVCLSLTREPVFLIVFSDGWLEVLRNKDIELSTAAGLIRESHIRISLNKCIQDTFSRVSSEIHNLPIQLDQNELQVLNLLRTGDIDSLEIAFKNGKPHSLKKILQEDPNIDLSVILKRIEYGEITIKKQNNKTVLIETKNLTRI